MVSCKQLASPKTAGVKHVQGSPSARLFPPVLGTHTQSVGQGPQEQPRGHPATIAPRGGGVSRGKVSPGRVGRGPLSPGAPPDPTAPYLHVAYDGLEEPSERATFLLYHSLHFPRSSTLEEAETAAISLIS